LKTHFRNIGLAALLMYGQHVAAAPKAAPSFDYGTAPSWGQFQELAEARVRSDLSDPSSAQFRWDQGFTQGYIHPFMGERQYGYWTCGFVNGKNKFGGYVGETRFVVVVRDNAVVFAQVGHNSGIDPVTASCNKYARAGTFPAVSAMSTIPVANSAITGFGFSFREAPDGAYIDKVTSATPAALAGLKPGMVVSDLNSIPLKGMSQRSLNLYFAGAPSETTLTIIGLGEIKLKGSQAN
jgi:membrane-associated protease RseP (regulator of RpoE activity)